MITERDRIALDFLDQFRMATPKQIDRIAYNNAKVCYKRLSKLHDDKLVYRTNNAIQRGYIYSSKRIRSISQFTHDYIRNEFYLHLREVADIEVLYVEKVFGSIRPDLLILCEYQGEQYFFTIEVETNNNHSSINYDKYHTFFLKEWKEFFEDKPTVVYLTNKKVDNSKIKFDYRHIKADLSNFIDLFS